MSIVGLMIGRVIERNLDNPARAAKASKIKGKLGVKAGRMSFTLDFSGGDVSIMPGLVEPLRALISGSLGSLMQISLGKGPVRSFLAGEVAMKGNPIFAFRALPLILANQSKRETP